MIYLAVIAITIGLAAFAGLVILIAGLVTLIAGVLPAIVDTKKD